MMLMGHAIAEEPMCYARTRKLILTASAPVTIGVAAI